MKFAYFPQKLLIQGFNEDQIKLRENKIESWEDVWSC